MRLPGRSVPMALGEGRPDWLTAGAVRLGLLCLAIVAIELLPLRLSPRSAGWVAALGAVAMAVGAALFLGASRRLADRLPFLSESQQLADAALLQLRRIGLPLLGLLFF